MTEQTEQSQMPEEIAAFLSQYLKHTYSGSIGLKLLSYQKGSCKGVLPIRPEFLNPLGSLHGGLLYTVADTIGGISALEFNSSLNQSLSQSQDPLDNPVRNMLVNETTVTTISGNMEFLRPAISLDHIYIEGKLLKSGKRIAFVESYLSSEDGTLYAKASFSFARIPVPGEKNMPS